MAIKGYVQDGGGPKDSENTLNSFLTKSDGNVFWQIGTDLLSQEMIFYMNSYIRFNEPLAISLACRKK